jgi:hypothetical protein
MASLSFMTIEVDKKTLDDVKYMLDTVKNGAETAIMRAANDTATTARSRIVKTVSERVNLLQKRIREDTNIEKANLSKLDARAIIYRRQVPLVEFPHITSFVGTSVSVRKDRNAELYRHRFKATMRSGHVGIYERRMRGSGRPYPRLPIDEALGPGIGNVFHYNDEQIVFSDMMDLFQKNVFDRATYILSQAR